MSWGQLATLCHLLNVCVLEVRVSVQLFIAFFGGDGWAMDGLGRMVVEGVGGCSIIVWSFTT